MAAYNNVAFVKLAIDSVKAQTYENWELVILDDGSTDGTRELVTALAESDERIKVHKNPRNLGYNATMVLLGQIAKGDLWTHFDSDDMLERYSVEEMVRAFDVYPGVSLIYSDMACIDRDGKFTGYREHKDFDRNALYDFGWRAMGMYKADVFKEIHGYNEKLAVTTGCIDGDLFMQIAEKFEIMHIPKPLYLYRSHGNHTSSKKPPCEECPANKDCNYIRVWAKSLNLDQQTLKPLEAHI